MSYPRSQQLLLLPGVRAFEVRYQPAERVVRLEGFGFQR